MPAIVRLANEVAQHRLGNLEVRDYTVLDGAYRLDTSRCTTDHFLGLSPDGEHLAGTTRNVGDCNHGGLTTDDSAAARIDERVGRTEIDGKVVRQQTCKPAQDH